MADRIMLTAGDARDAAWPHSQDIVLMSYLLSAVDGSDFAPLLTQAFDALRPGGRLIVHDFMLDENRAGPSSAALFFLQYIVHQPDAISFTPGELSTMIAAAGFVEITSDTMIPEITSVLVAQKPE